MPRKPNTAVGVCPCPVRACTAERAPIFRFVASPKKLGAARKAGKFYGRCPTHGWFGYDGAASMQSYIREEGTLTEGEKWDTSESSGASVTAPAAEPEKKPTPAPAPTPAAKKAPPKKPATAPATTPAAAPAKRPDVWNL